LNAARRAIRERMACHLAVMCLMIPFGISTPIR
jgi:hypothetical protein